MMKLKVIALAAIVILILGLIPLAASADNTPPTDYGRGYSNASGWAKPELEKAYEYSLIPYSLQNTDMTRPITREEFAELTVILYEKATGKAAVAVSPNPFKDTVNPEILKAFNVGVLKGTSDSTFSPGELTNREQAATMLSRTMRVIAPDGDYSTGGAQAFSDQMDISVWALEHVKFMSKSGIIKGSGGKFMPKAVTAAQAASGYATTTREQALAMGVRAFEKLRYIDNNTSDKQQDEPSRPAFKDGMPSLAGGGLTGVWMGYYLPHGSQTPMERYMIFYEDGTFYHEMPAEGLESFDREAGKKNEQQKDYWGTYTFSGSTGTWKYNNSTNAEGKLELNENGILKLDGLSYNLYHRIASVDDLHLEGVWTTYRDPADPYLGKDGIKPIIRFKKDGRFKDEGLLRRSFGYLFDNQSESAPGEGSYYIKDFTLTLKYDDGRIQKAAFSLNLENKPELNPDIIFMFRTHMNKTNY